MKEIIIEYVRSSKPVNEGKPFIYNSSTSALLDVIMNWIKDLPKVFLDGFGPCSQYL